MDENKNLKPGHGPGQWDGKQQEENTDENTSGKHDIGGDSISTQSSPGQGTGQSGIGGTGGVQAGMPGGHSVSGGSGFEGSHAHTGSDEEGYEHRESYDRTDNDAAQGGVKYRDAYQPEKEKTDEPEGKTDDPVSKFPDGSEEDN